MRRIALFFVAALLAAAPAPAEHAETAWTRAAPSVVSVLPTWPGYAKPGLGAPPGTAPEGTGVAMTREGLIVTAAHVVARAVEIEIRDIDGRKTAARLLAIDPATDLALLEAEAAIPPISLAAERPTYGAHVCVIGNAFGLDLSITCGVVSAPRRAGVGFNRIEDFIQTDAAVNPGASGAALVGEDGALVGLVSAIFTKAEDINAGVNFAVSAELLEKTVDEMLERME